jgi:hypothetical protein
MRNIFPAPLLQYKHVPYHARSHRNVATFCVYSHESVHCVTPIPSNALDCLLMVALFEPRLSLPLAASRIPLLIPLAATCLTIVIALCVAASRSRLHIPGFVGLAFSAFIAAMLAGHFSGVRTIQGKPAGVLLSVLFFLLIAVIVGSVLALFFYRHPEV